ncbi:MAG TPA: DUF1648 domain-containing protein [Syntrophomonadaceae bacterium]|nr:DUF1648 domain-containing protein [Syntrophomonadaceae bacterium]HPR93019.1 DUF1648 domain-containing protein [Syntrophomonadaceae bacterium]
MKEPRPALDIPVTATEVLLDVIAIVTIVSILLYMKVNYPPLPVEIPTHFGFNGQPDTWGGKNSLLIILIVMLVFYVVFKLLERFPQFYNYMQPIKENNAAFQYLNGRMLIAFIKTEVVLIFAYIIWGTIETARGNITGLSIWFLPVICIIIASTLGYFIVKMAGNNKKL